MTTAPGLVGVTGCARVAGVVGAPVTQSLSPLIHGAWIAAARLDAVYAPFPSAPDGFTRLIEGFRGGVVRGLNITVPFKTQALALADHADAATQAAGAANLLLFDASGAIEARNTDGIGMLEALASQAPGWRPASGAAVILGAGGAAAGAAAALRGAGVLRLRVVARDRARAEPLALRARAQLFDWDAYSEALEGASLVINATTRGLHDVLPLSLHWPVPPAEGATALDMVYRPLRTAFLASAEDAGWTPVDGLEMLIGQGRPSFQAFYDAPAPAIDVRGLCLAALARMDAA